MHRIDTIRRLFWQCGLEGYEQLMTNASRDEAKFRKRYQHIVNDYMARLGTTGLQDLRASILPPRSLNMAVRVVRNEGDGEGMATEESGAVYMREGTAVYARVSDLEEYLREGAVVECARSPQKLRLSMRPTTQRRRAGTGRVRRHRSSRTRRTRR